MNYEVYPIFHRDMVFNIITAEDLTFDDTNKILDRLIEQGAFSESNVEEQGQSYTIFDERFSCSIEVYGYEVFVYNFKRVIENKL